MHSFLTPQDYEKSSNNYSTSKEQYLLRLIEEQRNELILRSEVAVQLAEKVVSMRRLEEDVSRVSGMPSSPPAVSPVTAAPALAGAAPFADCARCAELRRRLAELEAQAATWRQNVKAALRQSVERERALVAERAALEERLREQSKAPSATAAAERPPVVSREAQTDAPRSSRASLAEASEPRGRRWNRMPSEPSPPNGTPNSPLLSPVESRVLDAPARRSVITRLPHLLRVGGALTPFFVAVHYENDEGWGVDTKVRVAAGMTVAQLKESCCAQFDERYQLQIDPAEHCIRITHHKTERQVVLSDNRELHSYAYFQRCEREKIPITLFLNPVDSLLRVVNDAMNFALHSPEQQPR